MPPPRKVTPDPSPTLMETPSSLPILDSSQDVVQPRPPDMITGVTGGSAKNESSSSLDDVTTQPTIIIYPTVPPETVIVPILCSIIIFPIVAASAICLLRYYNQRARAKDRFRAGFQQQMGTMFAMGGKIGATEIAGDTTKPEDRPPLSGRGLLDVGPQFMCMPELELDTVWKSEDDMSSENPTSSQPPSDEQQETKGINSDKNLENSENPVKNPETIKTNSVEIVPTIPPPPTSLGPCLVPPSLAQAKKAMKPLSDEKTCKTEENKDISVEVI